MVCVLNIWVSKYPTRDKIRVCHVQALKIKEKSLGHGIVAGFLELKILTSLVPT